MAAASPSALVSSVEKTNGAKLSRLLIDGGTMVLRTIFDRYHPPANLLTNLNVNYHALNNLLRRRVLHKPQWYLLFPPGGALPDSNTFDITLLYLLLTNICGLFPPPLGWHTKPLPSDTSVEANLARIKFFRNELYSHVTTTGIDTATFSALWLEISAVLVALGLPQVEINRLRAEHCGEEDFLDVLFEWAENEEDIKSQLKDMRQYQAKTGQTVHEVRQTQLEDQKTMQDIKAMVEDVLNFQSVVVTQKTTDEKRQTQLEDRTCKTGEDSKVNTKLQEDVEVQREKNRGSEILKKLAKIDTLKNVRYHADRYVEGTRLSVFSKVDRWLNDRISPNRVMVISGNAGMGKSVISAVVCEKMQEAGRLAGSHFCQHDRARHRNPKVMLQSLASQLCDFLPDYKNALMEKLTRNLGVEINNMEVKDLFELLFEEPLTSLNDPGLTYLMVIDGLDESQFQGRNELLDVIANYFQGLPLWIRFLVTTRPEINIAENLKNLHPLQLDPNVEENVKDIYLCFEKQTSHLLQSEHREIILKELVQKSEGVMLYAHYLVDFIKTKVSLVTPELLDSILPSGISFVYHSYFKRLETELLNELKVTKGQFLNFLHALSAAREPLPLSFVSRLLLPVKSTSVTQGEVNDAISCVSELLPVQDECIHFFHKSVKDWLIENSNYRHDFFVEKGHEVLSELCIDELDDVKRKGVTCAKFSDTSRYALRHGVQHMLQLKDSRVCSLEEVVKKFVLDVELVFAKLCVNVTLASEDVICVQKQSDIEKFHEALATLLVLLRKHIATLEKHPHTIFQTLLNEGGPELSTEALNLLETKYSEIAYMEYLHKENLQERVQAKFHCSAVVTCFDVSPQLDYMVCECKDNMIQLWSLHTGKQLWKRESKEPKSYRYILPRVSMGKLYEAVNYNDWLSPFAPSYRSVVFHPTEDLVLPGILSHAYTFDGDLKPLFLLSECRFWTCSISAEKTKMLTDCPNNAKLIIMWSLKDGSEMNRFRWRQDIVSFAWSLDGRLLAISDLSGSLTLVDVMDGYKTLAQTTISKVSGMIKFSPDCRCLYSLADFNSPRWRLFRLDVNMENDDVSIDFLPTEVSYQPWEFESCSETGFLLGDPLCLLPGGDSIYSRKPSLAFVLNGKSVLTVALGGSTIEMLQHDELTIDIDGVSKTTARKVALSLSGDTLFAITKTDDGPGTLMGWDITSGMLQPVTRAFEHNDLLFARNLVAVREGVLLQTSIYTLELWNFELSECIRSWTDLKCFISKVIPISEERVACGGKGKVIIVDTTREGIVSTTTNKGRLVACNSKCHVITAHRGKLQAQCGDKVLWEMLQPPPNFRDTVCVKFSPSEQYCVYAIPGALYVLDAVSGETLRTLQHRNHYRCFPETSDCTFLSEEECVALFSDVFLRHFLQLFNVKSGDLLSEIALESPVCSLAACRRERLIAIGFKDSKVNFKVLRVKLPGEKHWQEEQKDQA